MNPEMILAACLGAGPGLIAVAVAWGVLSERVRGQGSQIAALASKTELEAVRADVARAASAESLHTVERLVDARFAQVLSELVEIKRKLERAATEDTDPGFRRSSRSHHGGE